MAPGGLDILADPSGALLSDPAEEGAGGGGGSSHLGSALTVVLEGVRPRTVEIQALCSTK
jgi:predicted ATP-dependent serine protease